MTFEKIYSEFCRPVELLSNGSFYSRTVRAYSVAESAEILRLLSDENTLVTCSILLIPSPLWLPGGQTARATITPDPLQVLKNSGVLP